jgi:tricorn protease
LKRLALIGLLAAGMVDSVALGQAREPIRLANQPALSPDGSTLAFAWSGDIWTVPSSGGRARPLTRNPAVDRDPEFSPDGKQIAFTSDRLGSFHPYVMAAEGGTPRQVGFHSAGYSVEGWGSDGRSLLVSAARDHFWRDAERFFLIKTDERSAEIPLFDTAGENGALSPDGKRLLFTREGAPWWRKGYRGTQDSQVWVADLASHTFTKLVDTPGGALWPLWRADGKGIFYVGIHKGSLNLRERDLTTGSDHALTEFEDDSVVFPCISRDGSTIVFRHLFDFYRVSTTGSGPASRIEIYQEGDGTRESIERRTLQTATQVAFSKDGLEIAFIAGGDLWVMDTELREPKQITATPEEERDPVFSPKGDSILFVSDQTGQSDLWKAERGDAGKDWWLNSSFKLDRLSQDTDVEADLKWSPEGSKVAFLKGRGDLWVMNPDGKEAKKLVESFDAPRFDWSPDGKWIVYAKSDDDFNEDIWLTPIDGSRPPFNLSRHPDNEGNPTWSPDGKMIAFTGRRADTEVDIYFVYLRADEDEKSTRDRTLEKAIEKMKARKNGGRPAGARGGRGPGAATKGEEPATKGERPADAPAEEVKKPAVEVVIDFDRIHERIRHVSIPDSTETGLFWSPDSKKLAFTGTVEGRAGVYTVEFPDDLRPKLLTATTGTQPRWLETGNQVVWLAAGVPASFNTSGGGGGAAAPTPAAPARAGGAGRGAGAGSATASNSEDAGGGYRFRALQEVNMPEKYRAAFDLAWRTMRDRYYDGNLGNRNWDAIRRKYADMAAQSPDRETFATVVSLMLGELNGSHLGFSPATARTPEPGPDPSPTPTPRRGGGGAGGAEPRWTITTAHFGLRFETEYKGPGLKVRDVIPGTPADHKATRILPGEILIAVDGATVDPALDLTRVLNGPIDRDVRLTVRNLEGKDRDVTLRPVAIAAARALLYDKWIKDNRARVEELSGGKLGYLHIRGMNFPSFYKFEEELYSAGAGKDGLIIDVRENGGGSTADHLLTVLTQPAHAITIPRGGGQGYPQDRRVYATWTKPIVVLCNQNSFSNAEIFAHAIKTLKRGKLVGVTTAGGVISTGAAQIMDVGTLRLPTRGWFIPGTGEDMELNGAVPDAIVWPDPAEFARGTDSQIVKAVEVLTQDVKEDAARPRPRLRKASERDENRRTTPLANSGGQD